VEGNQSLDELAREHSVYREPSIRDVVSISNSLSSSLFIDIILTVQYEESLVSNLALKIGGTWYGSCYGGRVTEKGAIGCTK